MTVPMTPDHSEHADVMRVPDHEFVPSGPWLGRRGVADVLIATGLWGLLPGRVQGALCNCPIDRGQPTGGV